MIGLFKKRTSDTAVCEPEAMDMRALPILTAQELLKAVGYDTTLAPLFRVIGISERHFDLLYRQPLLAFAEAVQLAPASENHHHSRPGGLLLHTLEVIEHALHIRRGYQLPFGGTPEDIAHQEQHWTYGLFVACLLHDVGKVMSRIVLVAQYDNGQTVDWTPHNGSLLQSKARSYRVDFRESPYSAHQRLGVTLYSALIPERARAWLMGHTDVMMQTIAHVWGDSYESQVIGDIATRADRESTARNSDVASAERLPGASASLGERLIDRLRQLIGDRTIRCNQDGAAAWVAGEHTYLVCRPVASFLIKSFNETGSAGIPQDPLRIYDVLQEHGYALPTPDGGAVFRVSVEATSGRFSHVFTCLKMKTRRLWPPVRLPQPFDGSIRELPQTHSAQEQPEEHDTEAGPASESTRPGDSSSQRMSDEAPENASAPETESDTATTDDNAHESESRSHEASETEASITNKEAVSQPSENDVEPAKTPELGDSKHIRSLDWDDDVGTAFWEWVKLGILNETLTSNHAKAGVHFVEEGIFLVSPRIFQHFCRESKLGNTGEYTKLQKRFARLKINQKTRLTHLNVHNYTVDTGNRTARLNGWLVPYSAVFPEGAERPAVNPYLRPTEEE